MKIWKSIKVALGLLLIAPIALAANLALRTGPVDVSELRSIINQLTLDINSGVAGLLFANGTQVINSGTAEATLYTYTLPGGTLARNGDSVRVKCHAGTVANGNNKTLLLYFGAASITTAAAANSGGGGWMEYVVTRTGAATQTLAGHGQWGAAGVTPIVTQFVAATETLSAAIDIRCRATDAVSADTIGRQMIVEVIK